MSPVKIVPFLNPFVEKKRLEIVVDYVDTWPVTDPFANLDLFLKVGDRSVKLTQIVIPEVVEQLHALGLPETLTGGLPGLAPDFVRETVGTIANSTHAQELVAAQADDARTKAREDLYASGVRVFASPNIPADFPTWMSNTVAELRHGTGNGPMTSAEAAPANALPDVASAFAAVLPRQNQKRVAAESAADADLVAEAMRAMRDPKAFIRQLQNEAKVEGIAALNAPQSTVETLADTLERRAAAELLIYAEALRRERIYTRRRLRQKERDGQGRQIELAAFTGNENDAVRLRNQRADVRRIARDEPVIGAMFHVLRWFEWSDEVDDALKAALDSGVDRLTIEPLDSSEYAGALTRFAKHEGRFVTVLSRYETPSYFTEDVQVRQISEALVQDADEKNREPFEAPPLPTPIERLEKMLVAKSTPQLAHDDRFMGLARSMNDDVHRPDDSATAVAMAAANGELTEHREIHADADRELHDATESIRRNLPSHDTIGITWDRLKTQELIATAATPMTEHAGFKGYRIDVSEDSGPWTSLCTLEREAVAGDGTEIFRSRVPREGHVAQTIQNHSPDKDAPATLLTLANDVIRWAGGSAAVPAPLDGLSQALPRKTAADQPILALRERGTTLVAPRFGRSYAFRLRGVGLSGAGPTAAEPSDAIPAATVDFRRGISMREPKCWVTYDGSQPLPSSTGKATRADSAADLPRLADSSASMIVEANLPLAHWRVALHARGISDPERWVNGGQAFEDACARFVARSRDNWGRIGRASEQNAHKNGAYLSAVDPGCDGIELVTKAWMPFSTNPNPDRHVVTGRAFLPHDEIRSATFSRLVVRGENIVENERSVAETFRIPVTAETLPETDLDGGPQILAGFHSVVEVAGTWSDDAVGPKTSHYDANEGISRFSRQVQMQQKIARPIGGRIQSLSEPIVLGTQPHFDFGWLRVDACYAGLVNRERERDLIAPQQAPLNGPQGCDIKEVTPTRAEIITWRKKFFDDGCTADIGEAKQQECDAVRKLYLAFVEAQLGASRNLTEDRKSKLEFALDPQLVHADPTARRLVLPVFTFPGQAVYGDQKERTNEGRIKEQRIPVHFGELSEVSVVSIAVTDGGSGYDASRPPGVTITGGTGRGAKAHVRIADGKVAEVIIDDGGHGYNETAPAVAIVMQENSPGSGATAAATTARTARRLPWVDDEITWTVRIAWRIPVNSVSAIERPLELSAVREFRLYRVDLRRPETEQPRKPLAVLARPGRDLLERINLDSVEFTWVDAVTDRDLHHFEYRVEAIPEDENTFKKQNWVKLEIIVPDSRIAPKPDSMRFLPMNAQSSDVRRVALYFSDAAERLRADHVTYFVPRAAADPMLGVQPPVSGSGSRQPYTPAMADVFPTSCDIVVARDFQQLRALRPKGAEPAYDGAEAGPIGVCEEPLQAPVDGNDVRKGCAFEIRSRVGDDVMVMPEPNRQLGNPFFRVHVHTFNDDRFPALAHTAASDAAESDWLQFYPDELTWATDPNVAGLDTAQAWSDGTDSRNLIWYRYHFFTPATDTMSFHLATFYANTPQLTLDAARLAALRDEWRRFTGHEAPAAPVWLMLVVEEGLLAETYKVNDNGTIANDGPVYQVLRSTPDARTLRRPLN